MVPPGQPYRASMTELARSKVFGGRELEPAEAVASGGRDTRLVLITCTGWTGSERSERSDETSCCDMRTRLGPRRVLGTAGAGRCS